MRDQRTDDSRSRPTKKHLFEFDFTKRPPTRPHFSGYSTSPGNSVHLAKTDGVNQCSYTCPARLKFPPPCRIARPCTT
jgi:hypothetical protein